MANYSLVIDSKFKPFSYNDFLAPVQAATTEHKALETVYGELGTQAAAWEESLQNAPQAKQYYDEFQQTLQDVTNDLAENGLTMSSRRKALAAREQYANNIVPIEEAWKRQQADIDRQQKSQDKNNGRNIYNYDARTQSLDYYLDPNAKGFVSANLNDITNTGIAGGKALSERYIKTEEGRRFDNYYYSLVKKTGMNPQTAMKVLAEMKDENTGDYKFPEFRKFVQDAKTSFGVDASNNAYGYSDLDLSRAEAALFEGINLGITYKENEQLYQNPEALAALKSRYSKAEEEQRQVLSPAVGIDKNPREMQGFEGHKAKDYEGITVTMVNGKPVYTYAEKEKESKIAEEAKKTYSNKSVSKIIPDIKTYNTLFEKVYSNKDTRDSIQRVDNRIKYLQSEEWQDDKVKTGLEKTYEEAQKIVKDLGIQVKNKEQAVTIVRNLAFDLQTGYIHSQKEHITREEKTRKFASPFKAYADTEDKQLEIGINLLHRYESPFNTFTNTNLKTSQYNDLRNGIANLVVGGKTLVELDANGKETDNWFDGNDAKEFVQNASIGLVTQNDKITFVARSADGKETYAIKDKTASDMSNKLTSLNVMLGDFNPKTNSGVTVVSKSNVIDIDKATDEELIKFAQKNNRLVQRRGMYTCIITNTDKGNAVRIVVDPESWQVYRQTLNDELYNEAKNRADQVYTASNTYLNKVIGLYAANQSENQK